MLLCVHQLNQDTHVIDSLGFDLLHSVEVVNFYP
nr:MAG TPA: hypothetical protein [Caudoviricetes sp.]